VGERLKRKPYEEKLDIQEPRNERKGAGKTSILKVTWEGRNKS